MKKFPYIFAVISSMITIIIGLFYRNDFITITASVVGLVNVAMLSSGSRFSHILGMMSCLLYPIPSYRSKLYGEVILYLLILFPIRIYGFLSWKKDKGTENIEIRTIKKREIYILTSVSILMFIGFYIILANLDTRNILFSTLSIIFNFIATYLLARRSKYGFISYLLIDIIVSTLWLIPLIKGNLSAISMFASSMMWFVIDVYGYMNWTKIQEENKNEQREYQNK